MRILVPVETRRKSTNLRVIFEIGFERNIIINILGVKKAAAKPIVQDSDSSDEESVKVQGKQTAMKVAQKVKKPVLQDSDDDEDVDMLDSDGEEGM